MNDSYPSLACRKRMDGFILYQRMELRSPCWPGLPINVFNWKCVTAIQTHSLSRLCVGKLSESVRLTGSSRVWLAHFYPETPCQPDTITYASTNLELRWISAAGSVFIYGLSRTASIDVNGIVLIFFRGFGVPSCRFRVIRSWYPYWACDVEQALLRTLK